MRHKLRVGRYGGGRVWYVVSWAGVITPWALSLLALGGGVRMPISRSIRVTSVGEIKNTSFSF